jgi:hypothetical protein
LVGTYVVALGAALVVAAEAIDLLLQHYGESNWLAVEKRK